MKKRQNGKKGDLHDLLQGARRQIGRLREVGGAASNGQPDLIQAPLGELESLLEAIEEFHERSPHGQEKKPQPGDSAPVVRMATEQVLALIPDPCLVTDLEHRVLYANQAASLLLGIPEGRPVGKQLTSFLTKKCRLELDSKLSALTNGGDRCAQRWELALRPGKRRAMSADVAVYAVGDEKGRAAAFHYLILGPRGEGVEASTSEDKVQSRWSQSQYPTGTFYTDPGGRYLYSNPRCLEICGLTLTESLGETWTKFVQPGDQERVVRAWEASASHGWEYADTVRFCTPRGGVHHAHVRTAPVFSSDGNLAGHVGQVKDLPTQLSNGKGLTASERSPQCLYTSDQIGICFGDPYGDITDCNDAFLQLTGYSRKDLQAKQLQWRRLTLPEYEPADECGAEELRAKGVCTPYEKEIIQKSGRRVAVLFGCALIKGDVGTSISFLLNAARLHSGDRALRERGLRDRTIVDTVREGIWMIDEEARTTYVNQRLADMLGYTATELQGRRLFDFMEKGVDPKAFNWFARRRRGTDGEHDFQFRRKDGTGLWTVISVNPLFDPQGRFTGAIAMITDISARKRVEESLRRSEERYRAFVEQSTEGIWRFEFEQPLRISYAEDEQIRHLYRFGFLAECNDAMAHLYGQSGARDLVGARAGTFLVESDPANTELLLSFIRSGYRLSDAVTVEDDHLGNRRYFLNNLVGILEGDAVAWVWGTRRDITTQKHMEQQLRQSHDRYAQATKAGGVSVWDYNIATGNVYSDPTVPLILGEGNRKNITYEDSFHQVHPEDGDRVALYEKALLNLISPTGNKEDRKIPEIEYRLIHRDGRARWFLNRTTILRREDGRPYRVLGTITDITELKKTETLLKEREESYRVLFENSPVGIYRTTCDGRIVMANPALQRILGASSVEGLVGRNLDQSFRSDHSREAFAEKIKQEGRVTALEYSWKRHDGDPIEVCESAVVVRGEDGEILYYEGVVEDITDRRRVEEGLQESEERFRQLADNIGEIFWIWSTETSQFLYVSPAFERIFEQPRDALYQDFRAWVGAIYSADRKATYASIQRAVETGEFRHEYRIIRSDGTIRWLRSKGRAIQDGSGRAYRLVGLTEDITDRKSVEEELKLQAKVLENLREGVLVTDEQGYILFTNPAIPKIFGYMGQALLGLHITSLYTPSAEEQEMFANEVVENVKKSGSWTGEFTCSNKDGESITFRSTVTSIETNRGRAWVAVLQDVTSRRQAEHRLREQAALIDQARDAIIVQNLQDRIAFWSRGAELMYGWTADEVKGKRADEILYMPPRDFEQARRELSRRGEFVGEFRHVTKSGKGILVQTHWSTVHDDRGRVESVLIINTDVTEKREWEARFLRAQRLESLGTLAAGIAHDVNNVLAPILMAIETLRTRLKEEEDQYFLAMLKINTQRGASLIHQVLAFAKGAKDTSGVIQPKYLIGQLVSLISEVLPKSIQLHNSVEESWPIQGDATQLEQVFMNLFLNAIDAMPGGGELRIAGENVTVRQSGGTDRDVVLFRVTDTGTGISPDIRDQIFDPFFTTKDLGKGTGLGLATVADIVKAHGGFIDVESQVGVGTEFKIYLPACHLETANWEQPEEPELSFGDGETVMVVEDEWAVREAMKRTLEQFGYRAVTAGGGAEAIKLYEAHKQIRVVIMDMMMPEMNGMETASALKALDPLCRIVAISGQKASEELIGAIDSGTVQGFLLKPFTTQKLLEVLKQFIIAP